MIDSTGGLSLTKVQQGDCWPVAYCLLPNIVIMFWWCECTCTVGDGEKYGTSAVHVGL